MIFKEFDSKFKKKADNNKVYYKLFAIVFAVTPIFTAIASAIIGIENNLKPSATGIGLIILGMLIALFNFYLRIIRPWYFKKVKGSLDGYRRISGFPLLASISAFIAVLNSFAITSVALMALVVFVFDATGPIWLFAVIWKSTD